MGVYIQMLRGTGEEGRRRGREGGQVRGGGQNIGYHRLKEGEERRGEY